MIVSAINKRKKEEKGGGGGERKKGKSECARFRVAIKNVCTQRGGRDALSVEPEYDSPFLATRVQIVISISR